MRRLRTRLRTTTSTVPAPSLYLDFISGASFDPRITFSRGSQATLVDSTGKITYAPNNVLTYSQQFDNAAWAKTAATISADATAAPDGTTTADKVVENTANSTHSVDQGTGLVGVPIVFSVYAKAAGRTIIDISGAGFNGILGYRAQFNLADGTMFANVGGKGSITSVGNGWYRCTIAFTPATTGGMAIYLCDASGNSTYTGDGASGVFIWGAQRESVTYQTTPSTYVATTASAYYGPRFDYDPVTLAAKGLLIEEQRTNLLTYSAQFDDAAWTKTRATVSANATIAPDGTLTADKLVEDSTASNTHFVSRAVTVTASTTYTQPIYIKAAGRNFAQVRYENSGSTQFYVINVNLTDGTFTTGSFGSPTGTAASVSNAGNGWWRVNLTVTASDTTYNVIVYSQAVQGTNSYTGDGTSGIYLWGAQLEAGAFATSYIPTVASTVTRSADVATMTGTNFSSWYNQSQGTFIASGDRADNTSFAGIVDAADATTSNEIYITRTSGVARAYVVAGGVTSGDMAAVQSWALNTVGTAGLAYETNNCGLSYNGNTVVADTSVTLPTVDRLRLGYRGANYWNGHIRAITYYNTRLSNTQLQALTA